MSPIDRNALASLVAHQLCDTQCLSAGLLSPCVLNQRCITSPGREAVGRRHGSCPVLWYAADSLDIRPTSDQHVIILYSASICRYFDDGVKSNQSAFYRTSVCCWQHCYCYSNKIMSVRQFVSDILPVLQRIGQIYHDQTNSCLILIFLRTKHNANVKCNLPQRDGTILQRN